MSQSDSRKDKAADALANLAGQDELSDEQVQEIQQSAELEGEPADDGAYRLEEPAEAPPEFDPMAGMDGRQVLHARWARSAVYTRQSAAVNAHTFRKTMIPVLLVVGVLLMVVGGLSFYLSHEGGGRGDRLLMLIMVVSFPLAAVLFFGAWYFHHEVTRRR